MNFYGKENYKPDETVEYSCSVQARDKEQTFLCSLSSSSILIAVFTNPTSPGRVLFKKVEITYRQLEQLARLE